VENIKKTDPINEFKTQWHNMWQNRHDDKIRAEGIANKDYNLLSIERGTVIIATRKFKPLDLHELIQQHKTSIPTQTLPPHPTTGGWGKFIKTNLRPQNVTRRGRHIPQEPDKHGDQQLKKGGRGWLHHKK